MPVTARRFRPTRAAIVGLLLVFAAGAAALAPRGFPRGQRATEGFALWIAGPLLRVLDGAYDGVAGVVRPMFDDGQLADENDRLRDEIARLQMETADLRGRLMSAEGRLALSEMPGGIGLQCVEAPVRAVGLGAPAKSLVIGRGRADGVEPDMAVLCPPGIAGVVTRATEHQALVQLVVDSRTRWGAVVGEAQHPGLLRGTGEAGALEFAFEDAAGEAKPGDRVMTSGVAGSLFPSGLPVGKVQSMRLDKNGRRIAEVTPLAEMESPREVYVILAKPRGIDDEFRRER